jgi:ribulose-5-phosphate 4-epimerase/fuculose-1-phosphate aldolase
MTIASDTALDMPHLEQEHILRRDLAACYRLVALFGWDDLVFTHISARLSDSEEFLLNPYGLSFDEMTASSLVRVDGHGQVVGSSAYGVNRAGFVIHSAVLRARPEVRCVIHLHTHDGVAVSTLEEGLLPLNQKVIGILHDIAYHEYEGVALDLDERDRLQADLGTKNLMMLRNHGTLALGSSVPDAFLRAYLLETSCTVQVRTFAMGRPLHPINPQAIAKVFSQTPPPAQVARLSQDIVWPALLRKLDRLNPGYDD